MVPPDPLDPTLILEKSQIPVKGTIRHPDTPKLTYQLCELFLGHPAILFVVLLGYAKERT
jgi:hypothetical protein